MALQLSHTLAAEFPEFTYFSNLLDMAQVTWPRYGLSAESLAGMDEWQRQMLLIKLGY